MNAIRILSGIGRAMLRPQHPGQLVLFVTDRCNCRCPFCFNADNVFSSRRTPDITFDHIEAIARSLRPLPQLLLSGGEPFLRQDIAQIVAAFNKLAGVSQVSIPTNGTLTDKILSACEKMLMDCPDMVLNINLSLDHVGDAHDSIRNLPGCYDRLCTTYEKLAALRNRFQQMTVNIITVVSAQNVGEMPAIIAAIRKRFSPNYHALGLLRNDLGEKADDAILNTLVNAINVAETEKQSFSRLPLFGRLAPALTALVKNKAIQSCREKDRCFKCLAGSRIIVITNDGRLMPCEPLWLEEAVRNSDSQDTYCMARLEEFGYDVKQALKSPSARSVKQFVAQKRCWCTYACAIQNGILYSPGQYIPLFYEMLKS